MTQKEVLEVIKKSNSLVSNELARLFLLKKGENLVRDLLTIKLEKVCEDVRSELDTESSYLTAVHDKFKKRHDIAIIEGSISSKRLIYNFFPSTLFELKFHKASWVVNNSDIPIGVKGASKNNVWYNGGVINDINKMDETKRKYSNRDIAIHHILILSNPRGSIDNKYAEIIEGLNYYNKCLEGSNYEEIEKNAIKIYSQQLETIKDKVPGNSLKKLQLGTETVKIGDAFGVTLDLIFLVLSEEGNLGLPN
ncbi:hypothetical protein ACQKM9_03245 [Viridibacillus sp. NPDC093762]|uniref:hypothetical protein n=1 Tax=Viridibacillus sp. NPDC093762 TaxID=3390720 RepID=UPI003D07BF49